MNYEGVRAEVIAQWDTEPLDEARTVMADRLARLSVIAYRELAHPRSADEDAVMREIAATVGTTSGKSHIVLRKLIEAAQNQFGWEPTGQVLRAARKQPPKKAEPAAGIRDAAAGQAEPGS